MFKKDNKGFTIIEVLIVLAIAGLILLIVFLAVPALQRNSRNTQRSNDAAAVLGGYSEFVTNNNGKRPGHWDSSTSELKISSSVDGVPTKINLGFYQPTELILQSTPATISDATDGNIYLVTGNLCVEPSPALGTVNTTTTGATPRNVVTSYAIESAGGSVPKCVAS